MVKVVKIKGGYMCWDENLYDVETGEGKTKKGAIINYFENLTKKSSVICDAILETNALYYKEKK